MSEEISKQTANKEEESNIVSKQQDADTKTIFSVGETDQKEKKEKKDKKEKEKMDPKKKKKVIRRSIIGGILVIIVAFFVVSSVMSKNAKLPVSTIEVTKGDVEATLNTSGTVESEQEKIYYSKIAGNIEEVKVTAGETVKAGDVLLTYEETKLNKDKSAAELKAQAAEDDYKGIVEENAKNQSKFTEASTNVDVLKQQIKDYEEYIDTLTTQKEDLKNSKQAKLFARSNSLNQELSNLQAALKETSNSDEINNIQDQILSVTNAITDNTYKQNMLEQDKDVILYQRTIDEANDILTNLKTYKTEMDSQKTSSEPAVLSGYEADSKKANYDMTNLQNQTVLDNYNEVVGGLKADFDGVVTEISISGGAPAAEGAQLLKLQSNKEVRVSISLSKYDLEKVKEGQKVDVTIAGNSYKGEVTVINRMAKMNANNTPVVTAYIHITNPDDAIFLGVEAKVNIHADKAQGVLLVPAETVNIDKNGNFVYVVEKGVLVKRSVKTGISSNEYIEIVEGLKEGEQVVAIITTDIVEGAEVTAVPEVTSVTEAAE